MPARLPATAEVFAAGPDGSAARRGDRPGAGEQAGRAALARGLGGCGGAAGRQGRPVHPARAAEWGTALVELLDQDGEQPDDRPPARVNELFLTRLPDGGRQGEGPVRRRRDVRRDRRGDRRPRHAADRDDDRSAGERQAEALADVCGYVLDHAPSSVLPDAGGHRPHVNVLIRLEDLREPGPRRVSGLRRPGHPGVAAHAVLRRGGGADRAERQGPAPRRRPGHPDHSGRATSGGGRPGPRLLSPRLWAPGLVVRNSPPDPVGARRCDETVEPGDAVQSSPPPDPFHGMDLQDSRRAAGVHPAPMDRSRSTATTTRPAALGRSAVSASARRCTARLPGAVPTRCADAVCRRGACRRGALRHAPVEGRKQFCGLRRPTRCASHRATPRGGRDERRRL